MEKSSQSGSSGRGIARGANRRWRAKPTGTHSAAIAGVLLSTWAALSCGGSTKPESSQAAEHAATGGEQNARTSSEGSLPRDTATASNTGGAAQTLSGGGGGTVASSGPSASSANPFGGRASSVALSGGTSSAATNTGGTGGNSQSLVASGVGATGGRTATMPSAGCGGLPTHLTQLAAESAWQEFRGLWNRVNEVQPGTSTHVPYASTITNEQRDQWTAELAMSLDAVQGLSVLSELEILFLRQVITARIEVMRDGGYHYEMYLHRSPFPFEGEAEDAVTRLEKKLDTLQSLKERCLIEPDAYQMALQQVEREAISFFVLAQLTEEQIPYDLGIEIPADLEGAALVTELDRRIEAQRATVGTDTTKLEKLDAMRAHLAAIQPELQALPQLIQMLEACSQTDCR